MFTGLVEEVGKMKGITKQGEAMKLVIGAAHVTVGVMLGDSISVNGVCLTVTSFDAASFSADVMPETYRKSNLHQLRAGERVNLERAMQAGGRFGGHIVQGHIDGTGTITRRETDANAVVYTVQLSDADMLRYVIPKGSITVDGISLTVVDTEANSFAVSIIPHTLGETALQHKHAGDTVNIECDVIGKYVDHLLHFKRPDSAKSQSKLTTSFLMENGFL
ncbi:riboflavin synthase subunit alpha [Paenibacillus sp. FSL H8-0548]|uniref:riboflavin synthase n=1 Tax=Paenibacillus sp. FSL H8-0548 TaxID=1920422 RepID=UPI00096C09A9|nr:riboflavin synthase [Paenibacillus sp. FSL H8-0548]OMF35209.1 riboflavin synthase subunit alpha [Paenibacillus sp. FSL H8-0548]